MHLLGKILFTIFIAIPTAYYFINLNLDAFVTDQIKGRHGLVYSKWNYMYYFKVVYNFAAAAFVMFIPVFLFVPEKQLNIAKNKIREFLRKL